MGIWPIYKTLAGIDIAKAGLIMGCAVFVGDILQVGFGFLSDKGYQKRLLLFGLLASSAALFLTFASSLWGVLALMLLAMIGSSSFHPSALGLTSHYANAKTNPILLFSAFGTIGLGLSQIVFIRSTQLFGGHAYPLFIPLLLLLIIWLFLKFPTTSNQNKGLTLKEFVAPFFNHKRSLTLLYFTQVFCYGVLLATIFMLPDILRFKNSPEWLTWGGGHLCLNLGSMTAMLLFSSLSEKVGYRATLFGTISLSFVILNTFLFSPLPTGALTVPLLFLLGGCLYLSVPVIISWGNRLVPESPSTVSGLLMGLAWALSSLVPAFSGILASIFHTRPHITSLCLLSFFFIPSFLCIFFMPKERREAVYNPSS
jgi:FSR family fosmidomycin resistance protein-like MFS transporter